jgi:hypothetical protein
MTFDLSATLQIGIWAVGLYDSGWFFPDVTVKMRRTIFSELHKFSFFSKQGS